jgi:transcriptional regulator with XRE-family HTH domain
VDNIRGKVGVMPDAAGRLTANQIIAYNLARIRKAHGLTQEQAAERLTPYIGSTWSKKVYSAAERSYDGGRVRQFTGDDLLAFSLAFGVPLTYFFLPPRPEDRPPGARVVSGETEVDSPRLIIAANGYNLSPAVLMRLRELPQDEQPPRTGPRDSFEERYGLVPGRDDL